MVWRLKEIILLAQYWRLSLCVILLISIFVSLFVSYYNILLWKWCRSMFLELRLNNPKWYHNPVTWHSGILYKHVSKVCIRIIGVPPLTADYFVSLSYLTLESVISYHSYIKNTSLKTTDLYIFLMQSK